MKRFIILTLLALLSIPVQVFAWDDVRQPAKQRAKVQGVKNADEPDPNMDGIVEVSFKIDNLGKVQILNINSTSPQLADYVIKKLGKIQLQEGDSQIGKVIRYRFVFKKQA